MNTRNQNPTNPINSTHRIASANQNRPAVCRIFLAAIVSILFLANVSCSEGSGASNPLMPGPDDLIVNQAVTESAEIGLTEVETIGAELNSHAVIGVYEVAFDPDTMELEIAELRNAQNHYDLTWVFWPSNVVATVTNFDAGNMILYFDLELTNPLAFDIYDTRVLLITTSDPGCELLNPDEYTKHFNQFGVNEMNPFIRYADGVLHKRFGPGVSFVDSFELQGPPWQFVILIEGSLPDNCEEPYEIDGQMIFNPINNVTSTTVQLHAFDHQGNIDSITVDTTPITGTTLSLVNIGGDIYESAPFCNTMGAVPGIYECLITVSSEDTSWDLYDYIEIEVISNPWTSEKYDLISDCSNLDLGVIADPGGSRDSMILMAESSAGVSGSAIANYVPYYAAKNTYVASLANLDPANSDYQPYGVWRIDATNDGAFSFTNFNTDVYKNIWSTDYLNLQVWSVFDANPIIYTNASPDTSRYMNILAPWVSATSYPIDVCDDFLKLQYALFTTGGDYSSKDLVFCGTRPQRYTQDQVKFLANLDSFTGGGSGEIDPFTIRGIDTNMVMDNDMNTVMLYVLEEPFPNMEVEVFQVDDSAINWGWDNVAPSMTIPINQDIVLLAHDIELLPVNSAYDLNPDHPTLCVLATEIGASHDYGRVFLYDAVTGSYLEQIAGSYTDAVFFDAQMWYLDCDDGDWEIHVTWTSSDGIDRATVFTH